MPKLSDEVLALADKLEKLAHDMPPPNSWTPQFAMIAVQLRHAAQTQQAEDHRRYRQLLRNLRKSPRLLDGPNT